MIRHELKQSPPRTDTTASSFRAHLFGMRQYVIRRRVLLISLALLLCAVTIGGIAYSCHLYYVTYGGGLRRRIFSTYRDTRDDVYTTIFRPMRKTESRQTSGMASRSPGIILFYECGDQLQSCEAFNQPDICCPEGTGCCASTFTASKILCCNTTIVGHCDYSENDPPKCLAGTTQCSAESGGGCCPYGTTCTPNGCRRVLAPSIIGQSDTATETVPPASAFSTRSLTSSGTVTAITGVPPPKSSPSTSPSTAAPSILTTTVVQAPATTIITVKQGEVATSVAGKAPALYALCFQYITASTFIVAAVMGMM